MTTPSFPGTFAGKMAFCSTQPRGPNFYLTTFRSSGGNHKWIYSPGMNATALEQTETHILYLDPDTYYRIQAGDLLHWLAYDDEYGIGYCDTYSKAVRFSLEGNPLGSQVFVQTASGKKQVSYSISTVSNQLNRLGTTDGEGTCATFAPTSITPSLEQIRHDKQAPKADLTNVILVGQDLQGIDFTGAKFVKAQVSGLNLNGAKLDKADLSQTDLRGLIWGTPKSASGIILTGSVLGPCVIGDPDRGAGGPIDLPDFNHAVFSSADLTGTKLHYLNLEKAIFSGATLNGAVFDHCVMKSAQMDGAVALKAKFLKADLSDVSAQGAVFTQAVFDKSDLTRVRMGASSYLFDVDAKYAGDLDTHQYPQQTLVMEFQSHGIDLKNDASREIIEKGRRWIIHDASGPYKLLLTERKIGQAESKQAIQIFNDNPNLIPAILRGASCQGVTASGASLGGADLRGVRWYAEPATFENADLEEAVFTGALLVETKFTQAHISGADFSYSVLIQSHLDGCVAGPGASKRAISFEGAHLEGVKFDKASFSGVILTNAIVALGSGVPLLALPKTDQQYLTAAGLSHLSPMFKEAGFDLGSNPTVANVSSWNIDNSQSSQPQAPKLYEVKTKTNNSGFEVFSKDQSLFSMDLNQQGLLNQLKASQPLCTLFSDNNYDLALGAQIKRESAWTISASDDSPYLRSYRFIKFTVKGDGKTLMVYGISPVLIDKLSEYPDGGHFDPTTNLEGAFSLNSIGPAGVPFAWIAQGSQKIDTERFWTANVGGPGDLG